MFGTVEIPVWLLTLIVLFAAVTFASHFLFPSVRWFLRRRAERLVAELNKRLERPIQPFKLARRTDMIQRLIYDPEVVRAVSDHAHETGVREDVVFETAKRYAREIVPGFSASAYFGVAIRAARWLSTRLYQVRIARFDPDGLRTVDPDATVVYVMNHRSNMDYVLVTYLVADQSALSYAVGEWARVWPLNALIRALGGYFIRRRSASPLYRKVLARYVQMATEGGVMQAVFPEGGLSQTGRLGKPKVGILSYIVAAFDPERRDIVFVPVALNYDRVVEDTLLIEARRKGERRFRGTIPSAAAFTLRYLGRRLTGRARRFGGAGVVFGEPLSLREAGAGIAPDEVAAILMGRIAEVTPILAVPLLAIVLREAGGRAPRDDLAAAFGAREEALRAAGAMVLTRNGERADPFDDALLHLGVRHVVLEEAGMVRVHPDREEILAFYAASVEEAEAALSGRPGNDRESRET